MRVYVRYVPVAAKFHGRVGSVLEVKRIVELVLTIGDFGRAVVVHA